MIEGDFQQYFPFVHGYIRKLIVLLLLELPRAPRCHKICNPCW